MEREGTSRALTYLKDKVIIVEFTADVSTSDARVIVYASGASEQIGKW